MTPFLFLNGKNLQFPYDVIICRPTRGGHSGLATIAVQGVAGTQDTDVILFITIREGKKAISSPDCFRWY